MSLDHHSWAFGIHVAKIAAAFKLDAEDRLFRRLHL